MVERERERDIILLKSIAIQARSKQCLIGPAIAKLSAGDLGAGYIGAQGTSPASKCISSKK